MQEHPWASTFVAGLLMICAGAQTGAASEPSAAVAPTGKLRVAFLLGPIYATKYSATGELKGVAIDLGQELARRIGVPFEPVTYASVPEVIAGAKTGVWDVALTGINAERAAVMDFSPPYMDVEQGYLVRASVPITTESDVDKAEIRVGVLDKSGADGLLSRTLKTATLVRAAKRARAQCPAGCGKGGRHRCDQGGPLRRSRKPAGLACSRRQDPVEPIGMGVPKGRDIAAAAYVGKFVQDAKAAGIVKSAIERAALRGVVVAPK